MTYSFLEYQHTVFGSSVVFLSYPVSPLYVAFLSSHPSPVFLKISMYLFVPCGSLFVGWWPWQEFFVL